MCLGLLGRAFAVDVVLFPFGRCCTPVHSIRVPLQQVLTNEAYETMIAYVWPRARVA